MKKCTIVSLVAAVLASAIAAPAFAVDNVGITGKVVGVITTYPGSDAFGMLRGRFAIEEPSKTVRIYGMGSGSLCPNQDIPTDMIQTLTAAVGNPKVRVTAYYKLGNGSTRCVTSIAITTPKAVEKITQ